VACRIVGEGVEGFIKEGFASAGNPHRANGVANGFGNFVVLAVVDADY
jgi:hypothetical protein